MKGCDGKRKKKRAMIRRGIGGEYKAASTKPLGRDRPHHKKGGPSQILSIKTLAEVEDCWEYEKGLSVGGGGESPLFQGNGLNMQSKRKVNVEKDEEVSREKPSKKKI